MLSWGQAHPISEAGCLSVVRTLFDDRLKLDLIWFLHTRFLRRGKLAAAFLHGYRCLHPQQAGLSLSTESKNVQWNTIPRTFNLKKNTEGIWYDWLTTWGCEHTSIWRREKTTILFFKLRMVSSFLWHQDEISHNWVSKLLPIDR